MNRKSHRILMAGLMLACALPAMAGATETFDYDGGSFDFNPDCTTIVADGDNNYLNFTNVCDDVGNLRGWFTIKNTTDPEWIGDYTAKGDVRISLDLSVEFYDFINWGNVVEAEEFREVVIELRDYDNPAAGYPYTSVWYNAGTLPARGTDWKSYTIEITDVDSPTLPDGWGGFGAEDPVTYEPILPDHRTWSDVLAGVDEVRITTLVPGFYYSLNFLHGINIDNVTIEAIPQACGGQDATVYVEDGRIVGGLLDGHAYVGLLIGTQDDDVIVGTDRRDMIIGLRGDDTICGRENDDFVLGGWGNDTIFGESGNDKLMGAFGDDTIDGGEGEDTIYGGSGSDECVNGETERRCGDAQFVAPAMSNDVQSTAPVKTIGRE